MVALAMPPGCVLSVQVPKGKARPLQELYGPAGEKSIGVKPARVADSKREGVDSHELGCSPKGGLEVPGAALHAHAACEPAALRIRWMRSSANMIGGVH